jgi:serine/threonine-protein kinase ATR
MPIDRAYLYFFNDKDEPSLHAASGITRNYRPKPSFHALAHLYKTLGDYRFTRVIARNDTPATALYCFEYTHATKPNDRVLVAWLPTAGRQPARRTLSLDKIDASNLTAAERMPLSAGGAAAVEFKPATEGTGVELELAESPTYLYIRAPR